MNKNIFLIGILILLESCSVSKNKDFYYPKKKVSHTKREYSISQSLFKSNRQNIVNNNPTTFSKSTTSSPDFSKMSDFEQAVINSWDEFTEEQKQFFIGALIKREKIDSLLIKNN